MRSWTLRTAADLAAVNSVVGADRVRRAPIWRSQLIGPAAQYRQRWTCVMNNLRDNSSPGSRSPFSESF